MTPRRHASLAALLLAGATVLSACGGGSSGAAAPSAGQGVVVAAPATLIVAPALPDIAATVSPTITYLRTVYVDAASTASGTADGSAARPYRTITPALQALRTGDDVVIAAGIYRETLNVPTMPVSTQATRIRAQTTRSVTVKGSDVVGGWIAFSSGTYAVAWLGDQPEQVFRAGVALQQIGGTVFSGYPDTPVGDLIGAHTSEGGVWPGRVAGGFGALSTDSFTFDAAAQRLYVKLASPLASGETLEVSTRLQVLRADSAAALHVEGLDFAHANSSLVNRWGAVKLNGQLSTLQDITIRDMDGACLQVTGDDNAILDSTIERCGQVGVTGSGNRLTVSGNQILHNNTRGFNSNWEAGGMKIIGAESMHDAVVRNNVVAYNMGSGIWFDWKNTDNLIEGNTTAYNDGFGIHYESSETGTIRANRSYGNGLRGIYLFDSADSVVEGNAVFGNTLEGIAVTSGDRALTDPVFQPLGNRVVGNSIAWNDFNRNWIQLVLPGANLGSQSDRNAFKAESISPRMVFGFMSPTNPPCERLDVWQSQSRLDLASSTQTVALPTALKAALDARRLLTTNQLPTTLQTPGTY